MKLAFAVLLSAALVLPGSSAAQDPRDDHKLLTRYAGSVPTDKQVQEFGSYKLATGFTKEGNLEGRTLEGKVTRFVYNNPADRSALEIFRNYRSALNTAGLTPVWTCADTECGPSYARSQWGRFNGLAQAATGGDPHYLAGSIRTATGTAWVAVMVGKRRTQVDIVEIVAMDTDMVVADASVLAKGLDENGRVPVPGIYFDTDKSVVKPESKPALDEIARLLAERPNLRLFVVGHTDLTGDLAHNRQLSEARARAVVTALVTTYRVAASRLDGYGVGPLSPASTNATEAGRRLNRRVELVGRP
jgi:OmpA-OmpF porin, OOP family